MRTTSDLPPWLIVLAVIIAATAAAIAVSRYQAQECAARGGTLVTGWIGDRQVLLCMMPGHRVQLPVIEESDDE